MTDDVAAPPPSEHVLGELRDLLTREPDHRLLRFSYVLALHEGGQVREAARQNRVLQRLLRLDPRDAPLEDGTTPVGTILDAAVRLEHELG